MIFIKCIVDLHCDSITNAFDGGFSLDDERLHFSPIRIPHDYRWLQVMAVFIPDELRGSDARKYFEASVKYYQTYKYNNPAMFTQLEALSQAERVMRDNPLVSVLSVEGGAVLEGNSDNVDILYAMGVRLLTLTWNGANELCGGVMSGGGFTPVGRQVVKRMEEVGMVVDVSHLSDEGFFELCEFADKPFIASHSNARSICSHPRNLTDHMIREIISRCGLIGLNYYDQFIIDGGGSKCITDLLQHVCHILELGGENALALGSDFDGADIPDYLSGAERVPCLEEAMLHCGISRAVVTKIMSTNALRFFAEIGG